MKDRQPTRPGRVKITPENGAVYYAVMEMADEPTEVGTPPTKANLLKDTTAALLGGDADMVPDEAFVALKNLIGELDAEVSGLPRIESGSYTGKGGQSASIKLTFSGKPKVVFFSCHTSAAISQCVTYGSSAIGQAAASSSYDADITWTENSVEIYSYLPSTRFDDSGQTYYYYAIL